MGAVYKVYDEETGAVVALKTLQSAAPEAIYRLKNEFRSLAGIVHPRLVQLYDLTVADEICFFTMEYVDGRDFVQHVRGDDEDDQARLERFLRVAPQLLHGLGALHAAGRLHRDIKPPNVLVTVAGEVKLLDFDLTLIATGTEVGQPGVAGTFAYMAPEQAWGAAIQASADLYAAGVVFYEALAAALPLDGTPEELLTEKFSRSPARLRQRGIAVPAWLDDLVAAMLAAEANQRPQLDALLAAFGATPGSGGRAVAAAPWVRRRDTDFVGRDAERRELRAAYDEFRSGTASVVCVHGISGIGKTELLRHFVAEIEADDGALVLAGRCHTQESVPYKALDSVIDALSRFLLDEHADVLDELEPMQLNALSRLFPVLGRVPSVAAARRREKVNSLEMRQRGFLALRTLLTRLAEARPLVVWIDDLQWGDIDSAILLRELLLPPRSPRILLALSYRSEDRAQMGMLQVLADVTSGPKGLPRREVEIGPMQPDDARRLVETLCPRGRAAAGDLAAIVTQAAGSPFFIAEMSRLAAHAVDGAVSFELGEVMRRRLNALPPEARAIAELAAVAAAPIDRSLLLQASRRGEAGRPLISLLESECIVRAVTASGGTVVQTYHDRIREAVVEQLSAESKASCHLELATTLESLGRAAEPELLARHFFGAGRRPKAADYAVAAADKAASAFAFVHAAELYRSAREWDPRDEAWRRTLLMREGDSLANATRFVDGANAYLSAAEGAPRLEALELRRNAAEHLISAGDVEEGVKTLTGVLGDLGLRYPRTPTTAMLSMGAGLVWLTLRGLNPRPRSGPLAADALLRVDTCYSAAKSLVDADSIRGVYFSMQALRRALDAGDPIRLGRSLAILGGSLSVFPGAWIQRLGRRMDGQAETIATETGSPLLRGTIAVARGQVTMMGGLWRDALSRLDDGVRLLTEESRGAAFEALVGRTMALRSLEELGELRQIEERAVDLLQMTRALGNRYAHLAVSDHLAAALVVRGEQQAARELARENLEMWTRAGFHLQHLYSIRREALCDLYEGQAPRAYRQVLGIWKELNRSQLLRVSLPRVDSFWLRGRLALAAAAGDASLLADAAACARRLQREGRGDTAVYAALLSAGLRRVGGEDDAAVKHLQSAAEAADRADMSLYAAAARFCRGRIIGGAEGQRCLDEAAVTFDRCGIVDPERSARFYAG